MHTQYSICIKNLPPTTYKVVNRFRNYFTVKKLNYLRKIAIETKKKY